MLIILVNYFECSLLLIIKQKKFCWFVKRNNEKKYIDVVGPLHFRISSRAEFV
jgi:hypothetical protein